MLVDYGHNINRKNALNIENDSVHMRLCLI